MARKKKKKEKMELTYDEQMVALRKRFLRSVNSKGIYFADGLIEYYKTNPSVRLYEEYPDLGQKDLLKAAEWAKSEFIFNEKMKRR